MSSIVDFSLVGQVALITGSARGLGRVCALALAEAGADLVLGFRKLDEDDGSLTQEIEALGRRALAVQLDVSDVSQAEAAVAKAAAHFGRIDILVNNAAVGFVHAAETTPEQIFDDTFNVNVKGLFFLTQMVGKLMIEQGYGRIINLSSQAAFVAQKDMSIYCASKAAVSHLTKCLAADWAPYQINVNAVAPTVIAATGAHTGETPEDLQAIIDNIPLGRLGRAHEVAAPVVFLASPAASLITGTTLMCDGGWTLA